LRHGLEVRDDLLNLLCADVSRKLIAALTLIVGHFCARTYGFWARDPSGEPLFLPVLSNTHRAIQLHSRGLPAFIIQCVAGETGLAEEREAFLCILLRRGGRGDLHRLVREAHKI